MWSTQNEKTELITQKSRLKRRLFKVFLVGVRGLEPRASCSQRRSNLVLHVHELHLALSTPGILLSGALFSTVSTSSGGGCGQLCGRMEMLPWIAADSPSPGSVWIVALFCQIVKVVLDISTLTFCVAVDKEIRNHGTQPSFSQSSVFAAIARMNFGNFYFGIKICRNSVDFEIAIGYNIHWAGLNPFADHPC